MKRLLALFLLFTSVLMVSAQMMDPVHFTSQLKILDHSRAELQFSATIDPGWHVYSTRLGSDGPTSASFHVVKMEGAEPLGQLQARGQEIKQFDPMFDMEVRYFERAVTFVQKIRFTKPAYDIDCYVEYGACDDKNCLPPSETALKVKGKSPITDQTDTHHEESAADSSSHAVKDQQNQFQDSEQNHLQAADSLTAVASADLWSPVVDELKTMEGSDDTTDYTLLYIWLMGFVGGLLAVCMPCIWPIIPMTVSFFLKRAKNDKRKGVRDAFVYGLSIVVIYLGLGLLVTALFGSDTLNAMSTSAVFNIFLFLLLVVFALSFFGWFEIKLPDSWANKVDRKSDELSASAAATSRLSPVTSYFSIFLMAFTLVLVSFSCTAPIVGLLLVETATSGNWLASAMGMLGFALALALPFTLFAVFPTWLKQAPKSGSWMNTLKVVLGFIAEVLLCGRPCLWLASAGS